MARKRQRIDDGISSEDDEDKASRDATMGASAPAFVTSEGASTLEPPAGANATPHSRQQKSFVRNETAATAPNLNAEEKRHFEGLMNSSFGAKMMAKMGWQAVSTPAQ